MGFSLGSLGSIVAAPFTGGLSLLGKGGISDMLSPQQKMATSTSSTAPWSETIPYWQQTYRDIYGSGGNTGLLGQQMNNVNPYLQQGWQGIANYANNPQNTALLGNAQNYANQVLSGYYLNPQNNMALAQQLREGMNAIGNQWNNAAMGAGRYGSGAWAQGMGKQLGTLQGNLYGQYLNQMGNMANNAGNIYQQGYLPSTALMGIGQQQEQRPWNLYNNATSLLRGTGSQGTSTQPYYMPSTASQLLGAGSSIAGIVGAFA